MTSVTGRDIFQNVTAQKPGGERDMRDIAYRHVTRHGPVWGFGATLGGDKIKMSRVTHPPWPARLDGPGRGSGFERDKRDTHDRHERVAAIEGWPTAPLYQLDAEWLKNGVLETTSEHSTRDGRLVTYVVAGEPPEAVASHEG